jgi:fructose-bisphosphate aldolase class II
MISYKELGFVNTSEMFEKAYEGHYAVGAFNFVTLEQMQAIVTACIETRSPLILQCSANVRKYIGPVMVRYLAAACVEIIRESESAIPMALHLDHGLTFDECVSCIDTGFSSVMIDGSPLPYEENVDLTARVVEYAHQHDITVEGELGKLAGVEDELFQEKSRYTDPEMVADFVRKTGVDSLAISIGTSHGVYKIKVKPGEPLPSLRFDILDDIAGRLPGFPIVLHGASAILPKYIELINSNGGALEDARGIPEDQVTRAAKSAVCKVNVASDGWIATTATVRKALAENRAAIDPRKYLAPARDEMCKVYTHKNRAVLGSAGKA